MRKPMPIKELEAALGRQNGQLRSLGEQELLLEEGWECVRLCSAGLDRPTDMTDPASIAEHGTPHG